MKFGRTAPKQKSFFDNLREGGLGYLKTIKWKDMTPEQRRKVVIGVAGMLLLLIAAGLMTQNDEDMYRGTIKEFIDQSAVYDVNGVSKTTTSSAHQLVVEQTQKLNQTKARNYKTQINNVKTEIVSTKGNSMIATSRVESTEQIGQEKPRDFSHLFIFQGQKVGASWKISNLLEAEARTSNKTPKDEKSDKK